MNAKSHNPAVLATITSLLVVLMMPVASASAFQWRWLTHPQGAIDYWPRFSPDGKTVLFTRQTANTSVFDTVPTRGGAIKPFLDLTDDSYNVTRADWDWTTTQIAFTAIDTTVSPAVLSTWIVNGDRSDPKQVPIVSPVSEPAYPSWRQDSANADKTVVESAFNSNDSEVYASLNEVDVTTGALSTEYTDTSVIWTGEPSVSHGKDQIAVAAQPAYPPGAYDDNNNQIWILSTDPSGDALHQLDGLQGRTPDWSPGDTFLIFESTRACVNGNYAIFIEASTGGKAIQVTDCKLNANHAVWAPDAEHFAFAGQYFDAKACSGGCRGIALSETPFKGPAAHFGVHFSP